MVSACAMAVLELSGIPSDIVTMLFAYWSSPVSCSSKAVLCAYSRALVTSVEPQSFMSFSTNESSSLRSLVNGSTTTSEPNETIAI